MSQKSNAGNEGTDGTKPKHKGEMETSHQKGAPSVSNKGKGKHFKDESGGEAIHKKPIRTTRPKSSKTAFNLKWQMIYLPFFVFTEMVLLALYLQQLFVLSLI